MAEDKKKSSKRASRQRGLFSGPADPLMGGMGAPPRPKRKSSPAAKAPKPAPKRQTEPAAAKPQIAASPSESPDLTSSKVEVPEFPSAARGRSARIEAPAPTSAPEPPPPAPEAAPSVPSPPAARSPRPVGIPLGDKPSAPAKPELSPFPASMRLRMAKAKSKAEKLSTPPQPAPEPPPQAPAPQAAPEPAPQVEPAQAPLNDDPRGRITLPPSSERGAAPQSWEEDDEGFDLLKDPRDERGSGLMGLVPPEDDAEFDAPGRPVASLNVIEHLPDQYQAEDGEIDGNTWDDHHTDHNAPFDITARREAYEEDLEEPPSELVDLNQLPRGVIVRDDKANDGFTHRVSPRPMLEDAGVWQAPVDEAPAPAPEPRKNRAWWEERVGDENSQQGKVAPLPPRSPKAAPSFLGKTRQERDAERKRRAAMLGGGVSLVILLIIAAFVLLSQRTPSPELPPQVMVPPSAELPALPERADPVVELPPVEAEPVEAEPVEAEPAELGSGLPGVDPVAADQVDPMAIDPGFLNIRAEPRAVIFLNGKNLGQTPLERIELPPGEHTFKAVAPGKRAQVRTVRVDSGQAQRIIFRF